MPAANSGGTGVSTLTLHALRTIAERRANPNIWATRAAWWHRRWRRLVRAGEAGSRVQAPEKVLGATPEPPKWPRVACRCASKSDIVGIIIHRSSELANENRWKFGTALNTIGSKDGAGCLRRQ